LKTEAREIGTRVVFDGRQKHNPNSPIKLDMNEEVTM